MLSPELSACSDILVVDDDPALADGLGELLRRHGYTVVVSRDGSSARQELAVRRFSLVVSDLFMPDGDGLDLLASLRGVSPRPPFIAMSGYDPHRFSSMLRIAALLGASYTLAKPFEFRDLLSYVRELIGARAAPGE